MSRSLLRKMLGDILPPNTLQSEDKIDHNPPVINTEGQRFELKVLGHTAATRKILPAKEFVSFVVAIQEIKNTSIDGYDPSDPKDNPPSDFFRTVASFLPDGGRGLELYIAIDTPLDYFHGVDAFFCWNGGTVTIDVTANPNKSKGNADFIIYPQDTYEVGDIRMVTPFFCECIAKCLIGEAALNKVGGRSLY